MRVTDSMRYSQAVNQLTSLRSQHAKASMQALTGRRLSAPSDDPVAAAGLVNLRSRGAQIETHRTSINHVRADIEGSEAALGQAGDIMKRVIELAMSGGSDGSNAYAREALGGEVRALREQLLGVANTRGSNGFLFAGTATGSPPFDAAGAFVGNDNAHTVDIGGASPSRVNASGASAFTAAGGRDLFADLETLALALEANDGNAIRASLDDLNAGHDQIQLERSRGGLLLNRLELSEAALDRAELMIAREDDDLGAVDPFAAYSDFVSLGQSLERSIGITRQILNLGAIERF